MRELLCCAAIQTLQQISGVEVFCRPKAAMSFRLHSHGEPLVTRGCPEELFGLIPAILPDPAKLTQREQFGFIEEYT